MRHQRASAAARRAGGRLACALPADQPRFAAALAACRAERRPVVIAVGCAHSPGLRYSLSFLPSASITRAGVESGPSGLTCLVTRLDDMPLADVRHVATVLGLTPAEARLAHALAAGATLEGHAAAAGAGSHSAPATPATR